jgi:hypothetical protein
MAQTFAQIFLHIIFSTKERRACLNEDWRNELFAYKGASSEASVVRPYRSTASPTTCICCSHYRPASPRPTPCESSRLGPRPWVRSRDRSFAWQSGYAAFSVSQSRTAQVRRYIARQQQHHTRIRFEDELVFLLQRHQMEYDERYLLG